MGKQKSRSSRMSSGKSKKLNIAHEAKRQERFARRKEAGKVYEWKPNPYKPGSKEYVREQLERAEKAKSSRLPYAIRTSIFAKLDREIEQEKLKRKNEKSK